MKLTLRVMAPNLTSNKNINTRNDHKQMHLLHLKFIKQQKTFYVKTILAT